jgi:hypothetical protein
MLRRQNDEHIELQECRPAVADVSCAHANFVSSPFRFPLEGLILVVSYSGTIR